MVGGDICLIILNWRVSVDRSLVLAVAGAAAFMELQMIHDR